MIITKIFLLEMMNVFAAVHAKTYVPLKTFTSVDRRNAEAVGVVDQEEAVVAIVVAEGVAWAVVE